MRNRAIDIPMAPAIGGATTDTPGRNFAAINEPPPHFRKKLWFWLTQTLGVRESLQRNRNTVYPYTRPATNQAASPAVLPAIEAANAAATDTSGLLASAPMMTSTGADGSGAPSRAHRAAMATSSTLWVEASS